MREKINEIVLCFTYTTYMSSAWLFV